MGLKGLLGRLAARAPVPVFVVSGAGASEAALDLTTEPALRVVDRPAAATVLVLAGSVPERFAAELARVHAAVPSPRLTVWWRLGATGAPPPIRPSLVVDGTDTAALVEELQTAHRASVMGASVSEPPHLPDEDPAPWRGVGPYGQGGTGMTGGIPYGRPMAELAPDRDGLRLDRLPVRLGPFLPVLTPGLQLDFELQGDVVQGCRIGEDTLHASAGRLTGSLFDEALHRPVLLADLELARARSHLRWVAHGLFAHGLPALARRTVALVRDERPPPVGDVRTLTTVLQRSQLLGWATSGVGCLDGQTVTGSGTGPVARASGVREDARTEDPVYVALGFEPVVQLGGDSRGRWRQRLDEAAQSLELAERAGDRFCDPTGAVESPRGLIAHDIAPTRRLLELLPDLLEGLELGDAIATVVSLDLDPEAFMSADAPAQGAAP
jgi:hypothetical protein